VLPRTCAGAFGGPDDVDNGLCLCSLHHKLFDKGVLGVDDGHRILVSQQFVGHSPAAREQVVALAGRPLIGPQPGAHPVAADHRVWAHQPGLPRHSTPGHCGLTDLRPHERLLTPAYFMVFALPDDGRLLDVPIP
jgi:putative restriction endonuclease